MEEQQARKPPFSDEAEQGVLGSVLLDAVNTIPILRKKRVEYEDFYIPRHGTIYLAIMEVAQKNGVADVLLVGEHLKAQGNLDGIGGIVTLDRLLDNTPTIAHCAHYVDIIREKSDRRKAIKIATQVVGASYNEEIAICDTIASAQNKFFNAARIEMSGTTNEQAIIQVYDEYKAAQRGEVVGLPCFLNGVGHRLGRFKEGKPYYVGAGPGSGKSSFGANQGADWIWRHIPTAIWSGEMTHGEFISLMMAHRAGVSKFGLEQGACKTNTKLDLWMAKGKEIVDGKTGKNKLPLYIEDRPMNIDELCVWARMMIQRYGIKALIIDYVQIIKAPVGFKGSDKQKHDIIAESLRDLAKDTGLTILCLSQLTKEGLGRLQNGIPPNQMDLKGTGAYNESAYGIFLLYFLDDQWHCDLAKNRGGLKGDIIVEFDGGTQTFSDLRRQPQQEEF